VPSPPALTALLHRHLEKVGTGPDGLLFGGVRGSELAESTYCRVWRKARAVALSPAEVVSPLARRPYDLRHAAVST
jgi:integrase